MVTNSAPEVVGVVLAGGRSSRMGRDKALLSLPGGGTFLEAAVAAVSAGLAAAGMSSPRVFVSGRYPGFDCVEDEHTNRGPLAGVLAAARRALREGGCRYLLVAPIDMPLLSGAQYADLVRARAMCAGALTFSAQMVPLLLRLEAAALTALELALGKSEAEGRSVRRFLSLVGLRELQLSDQSRALFCNINTPEEFQHACEMGR